MLLYEDQLRKCVAFLTAEVDDNEQLGKRVRKAAGTAFFMRTPAAHSGDQVVAVTARHNISFARANGDLRLRMNLQGGDAVEVPVPPDAWTFHPMTDVAVIPLAVPRGAAILVVPEDLLLRDDHQFKHLFAAGDDVIISALFVRHPGTIQNEPVLRFGKIALVPQEPMVVEVEPGTFAEVPAILVEATSWGGQSGAPVFVDRSQYGGPGPYLLGLVHGHQRLKERVTIQGEERGEVSVNAGLTVVIPAQAVLETLQIAGSDR